MINRTNDIGVVDGDFFLEGQECPDLQCLAEYLEEGEVYDIELECDNDGDNAEASIVDENGGVTELNGEYLDSVVDYYLSQL